MADRQIALSASAANECENAKGPTCKCRCGGALHGARRGKLLLLEVTDPHSPTSACDRCKGTGRCWGYNEEIGKSDNNAICGKCRGTGRFLKPKVQRDLLKLEGALTDDERIKVVKVDAQFFARIGGRRQEFTVKPKCDGDKHNGHWYCVTHDQGFENQLMKDAHIQQAGIHTLAWNCREHGPEVP